MHIRLKLLTSAFAMIAAPLFVAGCGQEDTTSTTSAENNTTASVVPSYAQVSTTVSLDDADAAVMKAALADWQQAATEDPDGAPFGFRRAQMEFVADVAPSLDDAQLTKLVELLESRNEAHRKEIRDTHSGLAYGFGEFPQHLTKELGLTPEEEAAMKSLHEDARPQISKQFEAFYAGTITHEQLYAALTEIHDAVREKLATILTAEQMAKFAALRDQRQDQHLDRKLERIDGHVEEHTAWLDAVVNLNDAQQSQVRTALTTFASAQKAALETLPSDSSTRAKLHETMMTAHDALETAVKEILTDAQWSRLEIVLPLLPHGPRHT